MKKLILCCLITTCIFAQKTKNNEPIFAFDKFDKSNSTNFKTIIKFIPKAYHSHLLAIDSIRVKFVEFKNSKVQIYHYVYSKKDTIFESCVVLKNGVFDSYIYLPIELINRRNVQDEIYIGAIYSEELDSIIEIKVCETNKIDLSEWEHSHHKMRMSPSALKAEAIRTKIFKFKIY